MLIGSYWAQGRRVDVAVQGVGDRGRALIVEHSDGCPDRVIAVMTSIDSARAEAIEELRRHGGLPDAPQLITEGPPSAEVIDHLLANPEEWDWRWRRVRLAEQGRPGARRELAPDMPIRLLSFLACQAARLFVPPKRSAPRWSGFLNGKGWLGPFVDQQSR